MLRQKLTTWMARLGILISPAKSLIDCRCADCNQINIKKNLNINLNLYPNFNLDGQQTQCFLSGWMLVHPCMLCTEHIDMIWVSETLSLSTLVWRLFLPWGESLKTEPFFGLNHTPGLFAHLNHAAVLLRGVLQTA